MALTWCRESGKCSLPVIAETEKSICPTMTDYAILVILLPNKLNTNNEKQKDKTTAISATTSIQTHSPINLLPRSAGFPPFSN